MATESVRAFSARDLVRRRRGDDPDAWHLALVQRNEVWGEVRMRYLLDSLLNGYPIGSLLVCSVTGQSRVMRLEAGERIVTEADNESWQRALAMIHARPRELPITPQPVCELHALAQEGRGDAGAWKRSDNEIVELPPGRPPRVRFRPVSAANTPAALEELCRAYRSTLDQSLAPPLVAVAALILDFLCIHPFRDGNGRVSRLLTLLALYQHGFEVGRYVSLERLIEEEKSRYYETLEASSTGWHEGAHDIHPWLLFFLSILAAATRELERRASAQKRPRGAKRALVEQAIDAFPGTFSLADLERACPGVSRDMIRRVLSDLRQAGRLSCTGRGPGARWARSGNTSKRM